MPCVKRNDNGTRDYSETDLKRVEFIKCMRNATLSIDVLNDYIGLLQQGDSTVESRKKILIEQRELLTYRMKEIQETLDLLDYKIRLYEDIIIKTGEDLIKETI